MINARLLIQKPKTKYVCIGRELSPTNGTPHIHIFVRFENEIALGAIKARFPRADIRFFHGNDKDGVDYVKKGTEFEEYGQPSHQGDRVDIRVAVD